MWNSSAPAAAFLEAEADLVTRARRRENWGPEHGPMPSIFLSHGAPPLFENAEWIEGLASWADSMPAPRAILIVSAHWESAPIALSSPEVGTALVYDFGGFDPFYYSMQYATPDASWLARRVVAMVPDGETVVQATGRGLDHGAWVPLKAMYASADIPVLQMSIPTHDPGRLLELGRSLRELRAEGVLVIGSGFGTHGLPFLTAENFVSGVVPGWSSDFDAWSAELLARGDVDALADYRRAPGMPHAHPTVEHFSPIFVTLGAADDPEGGIDTTIDGYMWGLSRRSFQVA